MNILNLSNDIGGSKGGGIASFMMDYLQAIDKETYKINLWFNADGNYDKETKKFQMPDVDIKQLGLTTDYNKYGIKKTVEKLKNIDVLHRHGLWLPLSLYSLYFSKFLRKKVIIQPHGMLSSYALARSSLKKKLIGFLYEKANMRNASIFVANSRKELEEIKNIFADKDVALIPNGIPMSFLNYPIVVNNQYDELFQDKKVISLIARIHPIKGIERLIEAISMIDKKLLENLIFVIGGTGDENYVDSLKQKIKEYKLENCFLFLGYLDRENKLALLDKSQCFILPSYTENFSISIVEAMARKVPIITTKGTPWKELEENNCGFWTENTVEGIMNGIVLFLQKDNENLRVMGNNAQSLVKDKYIFEHNITKYETLYSYLCGAIPKPNFIY